MVKARTIAVLVASAGLWAAAASAQTSTSTTSTSTSGSSTTTSASTPSTTSGAAANRKGRGRGRGEVNRRLERQERRIHEGVAKGQLTQSQASQLSAQDQAIHNEEKTDRAANDGKLTAPERQQINTDLDQLSRQIRAAREAQAQPSTSSQTQSQSQSK